MKKNEADMNGNSLRVARILVFAGLALLLLVVFGPKIFSSNLIYAADLKRQFVPWLDYSGSSVWNLGMPPYWDPYTFGGRPFIASLQPAFFYPPVFLASTLFSATRAVNLLIYLHLLAAGYFMYLLLYRYTKSHGAGIAAALTYCFSGYMMTHMAWGHLTIVMTTAWLPLIVLFYEHYHIARCPKYLVFMSVALAMQLLAGHPQIVFYGLVILAIRHLMVAIQTIPGGPPRAKYLVLPLIFLALAGALAAPQLMATFELYQQSTRVELVTDYTEFSYWSLEPRGIIRFILPGFYGTVRDGDYWRGVWAKLIGYEEFVGYIGLIPVVLIGYIVFARKISSIAILYLSVMGGSLLLALGHYLPVYRWFYDYVFGFNLFRWPIRLMLLYAFAGAALTGIAWDRFWRQDMFNAKGSDRWRKTVAVVWLITLVTVAILWVGEGKIQALITERAQGLYDQVAGSDAKFGFAHYAEKIPILMGTIEHSLGRLVLLLSAFLGCQYLYRRAVISQKLTKLLLLVVIAVDMGGFGSWFAVYYEEPLYELSIPTPHIRSRPSRVWLDPAIAGRNAGICYRLDTIDGYDPFVLNRFARFIKPLVGPGASPNMPLGMPNLYGEALRLLQVNYLIVKNGTVVDENEWRLESTYADESLYQRSNMTMAERGDVLFTSTGEPIGLENNKHVPDLETFSLRLSEPKRVFLSRIAYPGWELRLNGNSVDYELAHGLFPEFSAPAGNNRLEWEYRPTIFLVGLIPCLLASLVLCYIWFRDKKVSKG